MSRWQIRNENDDLQSFINNDVTRINSRSGLGLCINEKDTVSRIVSRQFELFTRDFQIPPRGYSVINGTAFEVGYP